MNLKEMLKRDFGLDLPISGGRGASRHDPIVVLEADPEIASLTEMQVLRAIGKGRRILWTTCARTPVESEGRWLEQVHIETKELAETEIITQQENVYFDVSKAIGPESALTSAMVFQDEDTGLALPYELGWHHYDKTIDNEPRTPGMGSTITYSNLGGTATIYVYDDCRNNIPPELNSPIVREHFELVVQGLRTAHPLAIPIDEVFETKALLSQAFRLAKRLTICGLTTHKGKFVKLRVSLDSDPVLLETTHQSVRVLMGILEVNSVIRRH